jgi:hypothetical protein
MPRVRLRVERELGQDVPEPAPTEQSTSIAFTHAPIQYRPNGDSTLMDDTDYSAR